MTIYLERLSDTVTSIKSSDTQVISADQYNVQFRNDHIAVWSDTYLAKIKSDDIVWIDNAIIPQSTLLDTLVNFFI